MAKVALITQKITPEVLGLAQALKMHRHDLMLITSASEIVPDNLGFPVLTFFKRWSGLEALQFFPRLLGQAPDIWHFVFSESSEKPKMAHWMLAQFARALPRRVVASTFYDSLLDLPATRLSAFVKACDIVTTGTRESLMYLKRRGWLNRFAETEVLPPFITHQPAWEEQEIDSDIHSLSQSIQPYLVIPSERLPDLEWKSIMGQMNLVVCGSRPEGPIKPLGFKDVPVGIYYVGHRLSDAQMVQLLRGSKGLLAAFENFSVIELLHLHRLCTTAKTSILGTARQTEALPGFCLHGRNGFVMDQSLKSLKLLLQDNQNLELSQAQFEHIRLDLTDSALNELNRLYSKIQHLKGSAFDIKRSPLS